MLLLLCPIGNDFYALPASSVIEVLPAVPCRKVPQSHRAIVGLLQYHGDPIPVLDLAQLMGHPPCSRLMSRRILLIRYGSGSTTRRYIGLLVEKLTNTVRAEQSDFRPSIEVPVARYLGPVVPIDEGWAQRIELEYLLNSELRAELFPEAIPNGLRESH
jgi:chemotaxis-related protein WspB